MLARFSVLTRLRKHENSSVYSKMRVYDGESLKETDPQAKSMQEYRDTAGIDEGMDGVSTRFAFKVLSQTFNYDSTEIAADPVHLLFMLEQSICREQFPEETEQRYLEFLRRSWRRVMPSSLATKSKRHIWSRTTTMVKTCSIAMWITPMHGSRIRTSRIRTPGNF